MVVGNDAIGCVRLKLMNGLPSAVNKSGAVSPLIRAKPSSPPVTRPVRDAFQMIARITSPLPAPSAMPASRSWFGWSRRMSSVVRVTIGAARKASDIPPASAEKWPMTWLTSSS